MTKVVRDNGKYFLRAALQLWVNSYGHLKFTCPPKLKKQYVVHNIAHECSTAVFTHPEALCTANGMEPPHWRIFTIFPLQLTFARVKADTGSIYCTVYDSRPSYRKLTHCQQKVWNVLLMATMFQFR